MKKRLLSLAMAVVMAVGLCPNLFTKTSVYASESRSGNFSKNYTLTGNGADDMVAIAKAQLGRTKAQMGYIEDWCADFVSDCAKLAGQQDAIPFTGSCSAMINYVKNAGGVQVDRTQAKKGDLAFFSSSTYPNGGAHVEIITQDCSIYKSGSYWYLKSIGGNNYVNNVSQVYERTQTRLSFYGVFRPNYKHGFQPHVMAESEASGRTIPDGDYWIKCKCASNSFVDFPGSFTITGDWAASNNCNATAWPFDGNPTEYDVFTVTYLNNGFYSIKQKDSDVSLDVDNLGMTPGTNVKGWKYNGNNAQQWSIDLENNGYRIRSRCNAMSLDVAASNADGNITTYTPHDGLNQKYDFIPFTHELTEAEGAGYSVPEGEYWIKSSLRSDYYVDIPGTELLTSDDDYTNLQMYLDDNYPILQTDAFTLDYLDNGFYSLRQKGTDMYLTSEDNAGQGSRVKICSKQGSTLPATQQWSIVGTEGAYFLQCRANALMMDSASGGGISYENKLLLWGNYNGANQKFTFVPAETDQPLAEGEYYIRSSLSDDAYLGAEGSTDASFLCIKKEADKVKYKLEYLGDGEYVIRNTDNNLCLSYNYKIPGGFAWCYEYFMLHTYSDNDRNIKFKLKPNGDGTYRICNMLGGMPMDVLGGNTAPGTRIVTFNFAPGSKNQLWVFEPLNTRKKGDVNNNGKIDAADLLLVKSHIKKAALLSGDDLWCADVDDNGIVNAADLLKMKSHIKGVSLLWK